MATVIPFEERAVAHLRERLGAVEEANQDLIAFARGHSGAVTSIHSAVIAAMEADGVDALLHVITQEWPLILGIDAVALALIVGDEGFRADGNGVQAVEPQLLEHLFGRVDGVDMRTVERGHPMFGPACDLIRAQALIRIDCEPPLPRGVLALGQRAELSLDARHGSELLMFLGRSVAAMIRRWLIDPHEIDHAARGLAARWSSYLQHDRRRSPHTVRAYVATAHRFIIFLGRYRGASVGERDLIDLKSADLRAFLAQRRAEGLGAASAARELSGVRAFLKYAAEQQGSHAQLPRTRAPRRPRTLPRPASPEDALGLADDVAAAASAPWIGARDLAILLLLYGAGLRVAEALVANARATSLWGDPASHRQEGEDAHRSPRPGGARGDRRLCAAMPLSA